MGYAAILVMTLLAAVLLTHSNSRVNKELHAFVSSTLPELAAVSALQSTSKELVLAGWL